jgi:hypothetical protein
MANVHTTHFCKQCGDIIIGSAMLLTVATHLTLPLCKKCEQETMVHTHEAKEIAPFYEVKMTDSETSASVIGITHWSNQ